MWLINSSVACSTSIFQKVPTKHLSMTSPVKKNAYVFNLKKKEKIFRYEKNFVGHNMNQIGTGVKCFLQCVAFRYITYCNYFLALLIQY